MGADQTEFIDRHWFFTPACYIREKGLTMRIFAIPVLTLAFALSACATEATQDGPDQPTTTVHNYTPVFFAGTKASEEERALCEGVGGQVERAGRLGAERCIQDLPDAGEVCTDESECLGRCIIEDTDDMPPRGTESKGTCEATDDQFGCTTLVNGGKIEGTICID